MNILFNNQEKIVFYLHIPKTGGTTLSNIIKNEYNSDNIFSTVQSFIINVASEYHNIEDERKNKLKLIKGHFSFGYHQLFDRPFTYITMLRSPVARVISDYHHIVNIPQHCLHNKVVSHKMSLEEYVSSGIWNSDNLQTRFLSGKHAEIDFGQCSREHLELAKNNLDQYFSVVGLTERFDESLLLLQRKIGWSDDCFLYEKKRVNQAKQSKVILSEKTKKTVENFNLLDIELYEYAKAIFERQIRESNLDTKISNQIKIRQNIYRFIANTKKVKTNYSRRIRKKLGV